jgi:hypothetical protein
MKFRTRSLALVIALALAVWPAASAFAQDPPYAQLAQAFGTPHLAYSEAPPDKSKMLLKFVPDGEDDKSWTKMTTVSIVKLPPDADTEAAARGVIRTLHDEFTSRHVEIDAFDESLLPPATCYFEFTSDGETERGVVYSPAAGYVTVAQLGIRNGGAITPNDLKQLKTIIRR